MNLNKFLLFLIFFYISFQNKCKIEDFSKVLTDCFYPLNNRYLIYYKKNDCEIDTSIQDFEYVFKSKFPFLSINCTDKCPPGFILDYDPYLGKTTCIECPKNTYSFGNNLNVEKWNKDYLSLFTINCYSIYNKNISKKNENCVKFTTSLNKEELISGYSIDEDSIGYTFQLIYNIYTKNNGNIIISYDKDSFYLDYDKINGIFEVFYDNEKIYFDNSLKENNTSVEYKYFDYSFSSGIHNLKLRYTYYKNIQTLEQMKLKIYTFLINNIFDTPVECSNCLIPSDIKGASYCKGCDSDKIFNFDLKECVPCDKQSFIFDNKCFSLDKCDKFDIDFVKFEEKCEKNYVGKNTQKIYFKINFPNYCKDNTYVDLNSNENLFYIYFDCKEDNPKNNIENYLRINNSLEEINNLKTKNSYYLNNFYINNEFIFEPLLFNNIGEINWNFNGEYYYIPKNPEISKFYIIEREIEIFSFSGEIKLGFEIKFNFYESLKVHINNEKKIITKNDIYTFNLKKGIYKLKIEYIKNYLYLEDDLFKIIPVKLYLFQVIGGKYNYNPKYENPIIIKCPENYYIDNEGFNCINNQTNNTNENEDNNNKTQTNNFIKISKCPIFTQEFGVENNSKLCKLKTLLFYQKDLIRFNLLSFKEFLNVLYLNDNNILGPVEIEPLSMKIYLSIFEPVDFKFDDINSIGFIFAIQTKENKTFNLGRDIEYVKLVNFISESGIILHYINGDKCIYNDNNFNSYVYLRCDKSIQSFSEVKIVHYNSDNKCELYFEIRSQYFCKNCVNNQVPSMHSECYKKMKNIFYDEEKNCIIDKLIHLNKETVDNNINDNNLIIQNNSEIFNIYFNQRNKEFSNLESNFNYQNIKYNSFLLNKNIYEENCSINEVISSKIRYILYITIILFIIIILYMIRYFKKNKIKNNISEFTPVKVQENI